MLDDIEVWTLCWPTYAGNIVPVEVLLCASSRIYRSIVLLKNVVSGREMASYYWPQVLIQNFLIFFSINIAMNRRNCSHTSPRNILRNMAYFVLVSLNLAAIPHSFYATQTHVNRVLSLFWIHLKK